MAQYEGKKRFTIHENDASQEAFRDEYVHWLENQLKEQVLPTWTCGCGTINGVNLATCRWCGRKEGEGR